VGESFKINPKSETFHFSENPFGGLRAFQNGFARTRSDADASTHKKGASRHADASDEANADR